VGDKLRIGILGSGSGTNLDVIFRAIHDRMLPAEVKVVVSDLREAGVMTNANALLPAVPVTVRQAALLRIVGGVPQRMPVDATARALTDAAGVARGGVRVGHDRVRVGNKRGRR
jgi:hypothetical protein